MKCKRIIFSSNAFILRTIVSFSFLFTSCNKIIEVSPPKSQLISGTVFSIDATASSVMTGIYDRMISGNNLLSSGSASISVLGGLLSDELTNHSTTSAMLIEAYSNSLVSTNVPFWSELYQYIYTCNVILYRLEGSKDISTAVRNQLQGEAKFMRAFCYFYLTNIFGDVPLLLTPDYKTNSIASRSPVNQIYDQIISDLKSAQSLLNSGYVSADLKTATNERIRPNKWTATALLSRVYLYRKDWVNAEDQASMVIGNSTLYNLAPTLASVFLKNSLESIWQLQPVLSGYNTFDADFFILQNAPGPSSPVSLTTSLVNAFESGDNRRKEWTNYITVNADTFYYPYKYKIRGGTNASLDEYLMVFRLAEQYLIRSEARARQNNLSGAINDIDMIRQRAGLPLIANTNPGVNQSDLLNEIFHERQVELFTEWGNRWFDLKRINQATSILGPVKGTNWQPTDVLFPIPDIDIQRDANLTQNQGY